MEIGHLGNKSTREKSEKGEEKSESDSDQITEVQCMNKRRSTSTAVSNLRTPERGGKEYLKEAAQLRLLSPSITLASPELRRDPTTREQLLKELTELGFPIDQYMSQTRTLSHMQVSMDQGDDAQLGSPASQQQALFDVGEHQDHQEQGSNESLHPSENPEREDDGTADAPAAATAAAPEPVPVDRKSVV